MTRYMRYWDDLSLTQLLVGHMGHHRKDRLAEQPVLALILSLSSGEVTPVSHISLKTDRMDYREWCWKMIPSRVDPVECY